MVEPATEMSEGRRGLKPLALLLLALAAAAAVHALLPWDENARKGLALLTFIGLLWLTDALPLPVTALLVPLGALLLGFPGLDTPHRPSSPAPTRTWPGCPE